MPVTIPVVCGFFKNKIIETSSKKSEVSHDELHSWFAHGSKYNPAKNKKAEVYPVPVKFWHCIDDATVSYETTKRFVDAIKENGGVASLRTLPYGGHEPQLVGKILRILVV